MTEQLNTDILKHYVDYIKHIGGAQMACFHPEEDKNVLLYLSPHQKSKTALPQQQEDHILSKWILDIYQDEKYSES